MKAPETTYRLWKPPVVHCLADLTGYLVDLTGAQSFLERLAAMSPGPEEDITVADALSIAAIVRYCRCFTSGNRQKLKIGELHEASSEELALHERMRGIRDWHIAHPINLQEVHALHLIVDNSPDATQLIHGLSSYSAAPLLLTAQETTLALSLIGKWVNMLKSKLVEEKLRLKPFADKMTREQVLALPADDPAPKANIKVKRPQAHHR